MAEKITIRISAENKKFLKQHARQQNKSMSRFMEDLLSSVQREAEKDEWLDKVAGSYHTGQKDVVQEALKSYVALLKKRELLNLKGRATWEGNLKKMRSI